MRRLFSLRRVDFVVIASIVAQGAFLATVNYSLGRQADAGWLGKRVVPKVMNFRLVVDGKFVGRGDESAVFTVAKVEGDYLWCTGPGIAGWARSADVVDVDHAIAFYTEAIRADPKNPNLHLMRAFIYRDVFHDMDHAIADYTEAIAIVPDQPAVYLSRSGVWPARKEYDKAIADVNEAIRLAPDDARAYSNLAAIYGEKNDHHKALKLFDKAIELDPTNILIYINRAQVKIILNDYAGGVADYDQAIKLNPNASYLYNNRGEAWKAKKEYARAIADYDRSLRLQPNDPITMLNRATVEMIMGRKQAIATARKTFDIAGRPDEIAIRAALIGQVAARRGAKKDEAKRFLRDAKEKCDAKKWPYPVVQYLLSEIDEKTLLEASKDDGERLTARCFIGLDLELKGKKDAAIEHFRWVKKHGTVYQDPFAIAVAELDRLKIKDK